MLLIRANKLPSSVHGVGLFAACDIPKGTALWAFCAECDSKKRVAEASDKELHFGYISNASSMLVTCGDHARWWNFGCDSFNCAESSELVCGEPVVVATEEIRAGQELLIDPLSDKDAMRKLLLE